MCEEDRCPVGGCRRLLCRALGAPHTSCRLDSRPALAPAPQGNNVPMPSTLVKHLLRVFIPELIQARSRL